MRLLLAFALLYCVPWQPCYAEDFRWGRYEPVPWVPEQAETMGTRFVLPKVLPVPKASPIPAGMTQKPLPCAGCPPFNLPPKPAK